MNILDAAHFLQTSGGRAKLGPETILQSDCSNMTWMFLGETSLSDSCLFLMGARCPRVRVLRFLTCSSSLPEFQLPMGIWARLRGSLAAFGAPSSGSALAGVWGLWPPAALCLWFPQLSIFSKASCWSAFWAPNPFQAKHFNLHSEMRAATMFHLAYICVLSSKSVSFLCGVLQMKRVFNVAYVGPAWQDCLPSLRSGFCLGNLGAPECSDDQLGLAPGNHRPGAHE